MDPIKVDFSDNGKRKNVKDILIPPEKAGLKIVINIVFTVLPPLEFKHHPVQKQNDLNGT